MRSPLGRRLSLKPLTLGLQPLLLHGDLKAQGLRLLPEAIHLLPEGGPLARQPGPIPGQADQLGLQDRALRHRRLLQGLALVLPTGLRGRVLCRQGRLPRLSLRQRHPQRFRLLAQPVALLTQPLVLPLQPLLARSGPPQWILAPHQARRRRLGVDGAPLGGVEAAGLQPFSQPLLRRRPPGGIDRRTQGSPAELANHLHHPADAGHDRQRLLALQPHPTTAGGHQGRQGGVAVGPAVDQAVEAHHRPQLQIPQPQIGRQVVQLFRRRHPIEARIAVAVPAHLPVVGSEQVTGEEETATAAALELAGQDFGALQVVGNHQQGGAVVEFRLDVLGDERTDQHLPGGGGFADRG